MFFEHPLFTLTLSLFLLMDAIGNIPIFISLLKKLPPKRQAWIILRELLIALLTIFVFYFLGNVFLRALGISEQTVKISGGIILMIISLRMIFPEKTEETYKGPEHEPFIVPLAIPLIAGPAILATVMIYSRQMLPLHYVLIAITGAWALSTVILLFAPFIQKVLGKRGILALEKLMGLILTLISIQMFLDGLGGFLACLSIFKP